MRKTTCKGSNCGSDEFRRADGNCICSICNKEYRKHPYCINSALPESMQRSSISIDYHLHVLCNVDHVHL